MQEETHKRVWITQKADGIWVEAVGLVRAFDSAPNQRPYFSLTGTVASRRPPCPDSYVLCMGCCHEDIVEAFPELEPLRIVHLGDFETGEPNAAAANAVYWAGQSRWGTKPDSKIMVPQVHGKDCPEGWSWSMLANHLQVVGPDALDKVRQMRQRSKELIHHGTTPKTAWEAIFQEFGLKELWKAQAETAMALLDGVS